MPRKRLLPASPDQPAASDDDDEISLPSSPSLPPEASSESDAPSSDGTSGAADAGSSKKPRAVERWPRADEIALLEAIIAHREQHGRMPSPDDLLPALRGRIVDGRRLGAESVGKRVRNLQIRYYNAVKRLSRGTIPVKDDDFKIYKLSKRIWEATRGSRKGKRTPPCAPGEQRRELVELRELYPCLAAEVEDIEARRPSAAATGGMLKKAFERISDDKAAELEREAKKQRVAEAKLSVQLGDLTKLVAEALLKFIK